MGIYFNPGNESFSEDSNSKIYIDKTGLLEELNQLIKTPQKCISISHARRFGKSQAAGMLDAYYSLGCDSKELFSKFEIATKPDFLKHLNKYNVIHIDVASAVDEGKENVIKTISNRIFKEFMQEVDRNIDINQGIQFVLYEVYKKTGIPFIIILDEWDCIIRNYAGNQEFVHDYLQFMHSLFKSEESKTYLALAYITGILPIKKIKDESALNNFREYTMLNSKQFTTFFGFTEDEVKKLCEEYDMEFETVKEWYNGYSINGKSMYNPNSVCQSMMDHSFESYWKNTSSFETINDLITMDMEGLKDDVLRMIKKEKITVNVEKFKNDLSTIQTKDDVLTALIHLGYLGYDNVRKQAYIPNYEVSLAFEAALSTGAWAEVAKSISRCQELLWATIDKKEEQVAELLSLSHEAYTSILTYNNENDLSCVITLAYFTAPAHYNIIRELPSGKGFADVAFVPRGDSKGMPAMIVELKWDKDAETAIKQIKEKNYGGNLKGYGDEILLVGISYDKNSKKHECVIESVKLS